jgi:hypothetical protein
MDECKSTFLLPVNVIPTKCFGLKRDFINLDIINRKSKRNEINDELLNRKLASGQTIRELLKAHESKHIINMPVNDLIFLIQMLNFAHHVVHEKTRNMSVAEAIKYIEHTKHIDFIIRRENIWPFFLKKDKSKRRYQTHAKEKKLKELWEKQNTLIVFFEKIGNVWVFNNEPFYVFKEIILSPDEPSQYYFSINISPIDFYFRNYVYIDINELARIDEYRNKYNNDLQKQRKKYFRDIISNQIFRAAHIKFVMLLKIKYFKYKEFHCINDEDLNIYIGDINSEIIRILRTNHYIKNPKDPKKSEMFKRIRYYLLGSIFCCAKRLKYISSWKELYGREQGWRFYLKSDCFESRN